MAAVARNHGIDVAVSTFEDWDADGRVFDLVLSAQAWHWIDPDVGSRKAAEVLRPSGRFAALWNGHRHAPEVARAIRAVYTRHASAIEGIRSNAIPEGGVEASALHALERCPLFGAVERHVEPWELQYTVAAWLEVEKSFGAHRVYPESSRRAILAGIAEALAELAPITVTWTTSVVTAVRTT